MRFIPDWQRANPKGVRGRILLRKMNKCHNDLVDWSIKHIEIKKDVNVLDVGCGSGATIKKFLSLAPLGRATGIDISKTAVKLAISTNKGAIKDLRCNILNSDILDFELEKNKYQIISAICTVRFWKDLDKVFLKLKNALTKDGVFMISDFGKYDVEAVIKKLEACGFSRVLNYHGRDNYNLILAYK